MGSKVWLQIDGNFSETSTECVQVNGTLLDQNIRIMQHERRSWKILYMEVPHPFHQKTEWQRLPQLMPSKAEENCFQVGSESLFKNPIFYTFSIIVWKCTIDKNNSLTSLFYGQILRYLTMMMYNWSNNNITTFSLRKKSSLKNSKVFYTMFVNLF